MALVETKDIDKEFVIKDYLSDALSSVDGDWGIYPIKSWEFELPATEPMLVC